VDQRDCRTIRLRIAETLLQLRRDREAVQSYLALRAWTRDPQTAARASARAAELLERDPRTVTAALRLCRETILAFPAEVPAEDCLRRIVFFHKTHRRDGELAGLLLDLFRKLQQTLIGDNLLFEAAAIYERHGRSAEALALYDQLVSSYPHSPLYDDSLWQAAQILEARKDWNGALRRYYKLLATRREALLVGSYNSVYLDNAQLRVGILRLDQLNDPQGALSALELLRDDFPTSLLRDDAQFWIAQVHRRTGNRTAACQDLQRLLRDFPDGNQARKARQALGDLSCPH
jgi:tetratricopeptide (TPR) repeat protein